MVRSSKNKYKIVLIKTIENMEPIYYKLVDLGNYMTVDIPAYRFLDVIVNDKYNITNIKLNNNQVVIIDGDGYESTDEVILIDEFDTEIPNLYEFCLMHGEKGSDIINRYSVEFNSFSLSNYKIDSEEKLAWTCENNHTIYCSFATYFGVNGACPICEAKRQNSVVSLRYWCNLTNNQQLLRAYEDAGELNIKNARDIAFNSAKEVIFNIDGENIRKRLSDITVQGQELPFAVKVINLTRRQ